MERQFGIQPNLAQFLHQLVQVLLVGLTIGMMRTVVPALAEGEFGVQRNSFVMLTTFVVAFGAVKGALNFVAGRWSERVGRKNVLVSGWLAAVPIPWLVYAAEGWGWIVAATLLLGVNQGLTWSMTQTSKLDLTRPDQRGLTIGLNEFAGYVGLALSGVVTGYMAAQLGTRLGLLVFGQVVIGIALLTSILWVADTLPWAGVHRPAVLPTSSNGPQPRLAQASSDHPSTAEVFALMSWRDRRLAALCQAGMVEKFVDALVWVFYPLYLYQHGLNLPTVGWVIGVYGFVWGGLQLVTGRLSDRIGRHGLNVWGMVVCGAGVLMVPLHDGVPWWSAAAAVSGIGMAMLYPNLSASVADLAPPSWRGSAIGIYRFWRDFGYAVGALGLGLAAQFAGRVEAAFWFVGAAMLVSAGLLAWWGQESHPRLKILRTEVMPWN
jgi:MFS family permease